MDQGETDSSTSGWATVVGPLFQGGLPQFVAGPAGVAISRLIGAAADIPAAYLEKLSQAVRDRTNARSMIVEKVAEASAVAASGDKDILDRALLHYAGELTRSQNNREAIAARTVEHLRLEPPPLHTVGPDDDWLNAFRKNASDASSERMRDLYSRILAGEICNPGRFSLTTLRFMSILDNRTADLINRILPLVIDGHWMMLDMVHQHLKLGEALELDEAGFLYTAGGNLNRSFSFGEDEKVVLLFGDVALGAKLPMVQNRFRSYNLTRAGRELYQLLAPDPALAEIAAHLTSIGAEDVVVGKIVSETDGEKFITDFKPFDGAF